MFILADLIIYETCIFILVSFRLNIYECNRPSIPMQNFTRTIDRSLIDSDYETPYKENSFATRFSFSLAIIRIYIRFSPKCEISRVIGSG